MLHLCHIAYCCLAIDDTAAISSTTRNTASIETAVVAWSSAIKIEAAVRPSPYPALPVSAHGEVLSVASLELEASSRWSCSRLSYDPRVYGF